MKSILIDKSELEEVKSYLKVFARSVKVYYDTSELIHDNEEFITESLALIKSHRKSYSPNYEEMNSISKAINYAYTDNDRYEKKLNESRENIINSLKNSDKLLDSVSKFWVLDDGKSIELFENINYFIEENLIEIFPSITEKYTSEEIEIINN